ncbi:MAG: DUF1415 domain-containing protein [Betaproteobacteria bacterium]|nr:DUF1415 domain-containing protein [Betaproteobacteria bacterium]
MQPDTLNNTSIIAATTAWLERAVIGLNLCPFAKAVHVKKQIRYAVCRAETPDELLETLVRELQFLADADPALIDTTLLIHPFVFADFLEYNDYLDVFDAVIGELGLEGELQIASLHPRYQFANTDAEDITNFTNRSPFPTLHLLREASVDRAVAAFPEAEDIFEKNILTMRGLGKAGWDKLKL